MADNTSAFCVIPCDSVAIYLPFNQDPRQLRMNLCSGLTVQTERHCKYFRGFCGFRGHSLLSL